MLPGSRCSTSTTPTPRSAELHRREYAHDEPRSDGRDLEHALEKVLPRLRGRASRSC